MHALKLFHFDLRRVEIAFPRARLCYARAHCTHVPCFPRSKPVASACAACSRLTGLCRVFGACLRGEHSWKFDSMVQN